MGASAAVWCALHPPRTARIARIARLVRLFPQQVTPCFAARPHARQAGTFCRPVQYQNLTYSAKTLNPSRNLMYSGYITGPISPPIFLLFFTRASPYILSPHLDSGIARQRGVDVPLNCSCVHVAVNSFKINRKPT